MSNLAKFCLYGGIVLVVAVGSLWFVGGKKLEYSASISIDAPASRVYRYLSEPDLLNEWSEEILEIEPYVSTGGDVDPSSAGSLAEVLVDRGGQQVSMRQQIIKYERDEMISMQRTNDFIKSTAIFRLSENSVKTELTYRIKESRRGLSRILGFFSGSDRQDLVKNEVRLLKQMVESNLGKDLGELPRFQLIGAETEDGQDQNDDFSTSGSPSGAPAELIPPSNTQQQNRPDQAFGDQ